MLMDIRVRLLSVNAGFLQQSSSAEEHRSNKGSGMWFEFFDMLLVDANI
jgi:hypothetical protein